MSEQSLSSDAIIKLPVLLYGSVQVTKPKTGELYAQTDMSNPIPSAPTGLAAVDAGLGDAINLSWTSSASYFNVYTKVGAVYTKLNPTVLTEGTSYLAGGLTTDVPVDLVVRAANGLGQESGDSNIATATPTLASDMPRFTNPTYAVYINGVLWPTAILSSVELGFGSDLSTASFVLPIDPRGTAPALNEPVDVYINSRLIFRGYTSIKNDSIDANGLQINYVCHSNIVDLMSSTLFSTDVDSIATVFNVSDTTPANTVIIKNAANVNIILDKLGVSGGPNEYPGHVDITDQTRLAAAELVLSRIGNYRLYHDMVTGATSVYRFGSHGFATRQFQFSKNIVSYKIDESYIDVVKKITVIGAPTQVTRTYAVGGLTAKVDPDGRMSMSFHVSGHNIRDIQVYGTQMAKPTATFDEEIQVTMADFVGASESSDAFKAAFADTSFGWHSATGEVLNNTNYKTLFPTLTGIKKYRPARTGLGAKIVYSDSDSATVYLSEVPKMWYSVTKTGNVKRATVGQKNATFGGETLAVEILLNYDFYTGTVEVEYTVDSSPPVVTAGSGEPSKSITDRQYEVGLNSSPSMGSYNSSDVLTRMNARALAELAKASLPPLSGSITVIGDETLDLRSSVSVKGQLLEVSHVSHSFQDGYVTTVTLTNEPFVKDIVFKPTVYGEASSKSSESAHKTSYYDLRTASYARLKKELASQKDATDKQASSSGKFAIYQD